MRETKFGTDRQTNKHTNEAGYRVAPQLKIEILMLIDLLHECGLNGEKLNRFSLRKLHRFTLF